MALDSYTALKAAIADYLARTDLTSQIPDFITLTEAQIARRVRRKTIYTTITVTTASTALPTDCAEVRSLVPVTGSKAQDRALSIATVPMLADINANRAGTSGRPQAFAVVGTNLLVAPAPDQSYTLTISYYQKLVPLATTSPGVLLPEAPDIYLYGALSEAAPYLEHDERIDTWKARFDAAIEELDNARQREETNAALKKARLPRVF
jgi:hypothetical protein